MTCEPKHSKTQVGNCSNILTVQNDMQFYYATISFVNKYLVTVSYHSFWV